MRLDIMSRCAMHIYYMRHYKFGFSLIEVLIAVVIISIGLLGFASLQQKSMLTLQKSDTFGTAAMLATDIATRISYNQTEAAKGVNSTYIYTTTNTSSLNAQGGIYSTNCFSVNSSYSSSGSTIPGCSSAQLAAADLAQWTNEIQVLLPGGKGTICAANSNSTACSNTPNSNSNNISSYIINISWNNPNTTTGTDSYQLVVPIYMPP